MWKEGVSETGREGPGKLQLSPGRAATSPHGRGTSLLVVSVIFPGDNSVQDGCPHCDYSVSATSLVCSQEDGTAYLERRLSLCFGLLASHFTFPFLGHIFLVLSSGLLLNSV